MNICVIFGYGNNELNRQAKARADKVVQLYVAGKVESIYCGSINAQRIKKYLSKFIPPEKITIKPYGMTTAGEIEILSQLLSSDSRIISVSSWYHKPRILLIWKSYKIISTFVGVREGVTFFDLVREVPLLVLALAAPKSFSKIK